MRKIFSLKTLALMACLLCSISAAAAEAYANYTPANTTLTFYYDNYRSSRSGTTYDLNTGGSYPGWKSDGTNSSVTLVVFDPSFAAARPTTTYAWFFFMENLHSISGMNFLNTSQVTNMISMFSHCTSLTSLDVSGFNTANVTSMCGMFSECTSLTGLDLSNFNTSNVTDMSWMFYNCLGLTSLDLRNFNTEKVTTMYYMFGSSQNLANVDVSSFNTANVTDMSYMFAHCLSLTSLDVSNFNTEKVRTMGSMFYECEQLTSLDLSNFNTSNVMGMGYMFCNCYSLTSLDVSSFNTENVINMEFMFATCFSLTSLDVSNFNTEKVRTMSYMFFDCEQLTSLDLSSFNTANVTNMSSMFDCCYVLTSLDLSSFNTANVTNMKNMFNWCKKLTTIIVGDGWSTDAVTESSGMFYNCTNLVGGMGTTYDASHVDKEYAHIDGGTANPGYFTAPPEAYACYTPENTTLTFYYDNQRSTRTGSTFDLNEGENRPGWYKYSIYSAATQVVFDPSFADARPTTTYYWFWRMNKITTVTGLENLNTSEVTDMRYMFSECKQLTSLDLRSFNTENVTNMKNVFSSCSHLTSIDLSSWNTAKVTDMDAMFWFCSALTTIYAGSEWTTAAVTSSESMFGSCTNLVGGKGTTYNSRYTDKTYARIDRGQIYPGYFTEKSPEAYAVYTPENTTLTFYYDTRRGSRPGTNYELTVDDDEWFMIWYNDIHSSVTQVVFDPSFADARPTSTSMWFFDMEHLESIIGMEDYLNTSEVTDMGGMFEGCKSLTSLDVSNFNTANVTHMGGMFYDCRSLTDIDVSGFNTANVTNMAGMFGNCYALTSLDVSRFNTAKVTDMAQMFFCCLPLTSLDLSRFNTANVTYMYYMFAGCHDLTTIYVGSGWSTEAATISDLMFEECYKLVGGMGTTYDRNHLDKTYAHIDEGPSNPGYFSEVPILRGDVNSDGVVNIADVTEIIDYLLYGDEVDFNFDAADTNGDGRVNIGDVADITDYILHGHWF